MKRLAPRSPKTSANGWFAVRCYFYGHKIMGYVLASFLIAELSGLTKYK